MINRVIDFVLFFSSGCLVAVLIIFVIIFICDFLGIDWRDYLEDDLTRSLRQEKSELTQTLIEMTNHKISLCGQIKFLYENIDNLHKKIFELNKEQNKLDVARSFLDQISKSPNGGMSEFDFKLRLETVRELISKRE